MDLKKISYGIILVGIILVFIPQKVAINLADEQVTAWSGAGMASEGAFSLKTGSVQGGEGFGHTLEVWNTEGIAMNATAENIAVPDSEIFLFEGGLSRLEFFVGEELEFDIEITGTIATDESVEIRGHLMYFRHMEPDYMTTYPYRVYGVAIALLAYFASLRVPDTDDKQDA